MKSHFLLGGLLLASAVGLRAQMSTDGMSPMSTTLPWDVSGSAVYGFRLKETGVSVEGGKFIAPGQFVGLEGTSFRTKETDSFATFPVYSKEYITTALATYRYNWLVPNMPDLSLYIGAGAGVGFVRLRSDYPAFHFSQSAHSDSFAADGKVGVEYMFTHNWGVKVGYRYFRVYGVNLFNSRGEIHDNLAEAGVNFKF